MEEFESDHVCYELGTFGSEEVFEEGLLVPGEKYHLGRVPVLRLPANFFPVFEDSFRYPELNYVPEKNRRVISICESKESFLYYIRMLFDQRSTELSCSMIGKTLLL